jgi:hypothetical protein
MSAEKETNTIAWRFKDPKYKKLDHFTLPKIPFFQLGETK